MAYNQGVDVQTVVNSGPGLVFVTYPEVVLKLPGGSIWAITFFFMLLIIGIDSEFCLVESLVTGIVDMWPEKLRPIRRQFTAGLCFFLFLMGTFMVTRGGAFIFQLADFYGASGIAIIFCCFFQTIAIGWIFGVKRFAGCIEQMTGFRPNNYWLITWGVIAPLVMLVIFFFYIIKFEPVKYGNVSYPTWAHVIGLLMSASSMLWIPGYAIYYLWTGEGTLAEKWNRGITPDIKTQRHKMPSKASGVNLMAADASTTKLIKNNTFLTPGNHV